MPLALGQLEASLQIALTVIPVALYFLILGLLNSQRRPQVLSARLDFALLLATMSPLVAVPVLSWLGAGPRAMGITAVAVGAAIALLAPRPGEGWVLYNIGLDEAMENVERALRETGLRCTRHGRWLRLDAGATLVVSSFPLLRNVSLTVKGYRPELAESLARFEASLNRGMGRLEAVPSPMAAAFVLVATVVLVAPLVLLADRMPEMVRILTDLIH